MSFSKYRAKRMTNDGYSFASQGESACYNMLKLMERAGEIENIRVQQHIYLTDALIDYIVDFIVFDKKIGGDVWIEFKGFETTTWRIKRKLWKSYGPGILKVYKQAGQRIYLHEEIKGP